MDDFYEKFRGRLDALTRDAVNAVGDTTWGAVKGSARLVSRSVGWLLGTSESAREGFSLARSGESMSYVPNLDKPHAIEEPSKGFASMLSGHFLSVGIGHDSFSHGDLGDLSSPMPARMAQAGRASGLGLA